MESEFLLVWVPTALLHLAYPQPLLLLLKTRCMMLGVHEQGGWMHTQTQSDHTGKGWERGWWVKVQLETDGCSQPSHFCLLDLGSPSCTSLNISGKLSIRHLPLHLDWVAQNCFSRRKLFCIRTGTLGGGSWVKKPGHLLGVLSECSWACGTARYLCR